MKRKFASFFVALFLTNFIFNLYFILLSEQISKHSNYLRYSYINPFHPNFYLNMAFLVILPVPLFLIFYRKRRNVFLNIAIPTIITSLVGLIMSMFFSISWSAPVWGWADCLKQMVKFAIVYIVFLGLYLGTYRLIDR